MYSHFSASGTMANRIERPSEISRDDEDIVVALKHRCDLLQEVDERGSGRPGWSKGELVRYLICHRGSGGFSYRPGGADRPPRAPPGCALAPPRVQTRPSVWVARTKFISFLNTNKQR